MGDTPSAPRSSNVMALGNDELGLPGFPRVPLLPTGGGQVAGAQSWHAHRLRLCASYCRKH
jgi:hypothetical protein